jgi:hypothetical protein
MPAEESIGAGNCDLRVAELEQQLAKARGQQTATAEVLRVISRSRSDVQPVFDAIVRICKQLFDARGAAVTRVVGCELRLAAFTSFGREADLAIHELYPLPIDGNTPVGLAARDCTSVLVRDMELDDRVPPRSRGIARRRGYRTLLVVPMQLRVKS